MDRAPARLALIEVSEAQGRDGQPARWVDVHAWPLRVGRALDNELVLDDPHVAAHHLVLDTDEAGCIQLTVLDTTNGVQLGRQHLRSGQTGPLPAEGAVLQLGSSSLRLRLPAEALAPERPLRRVAPTRAPVLALLLLALLGLDYTEAALGLDPGAELTAWLPRLVALPALLLGWCGMWALLSKLFQHRFDFMGHLRISLPWLLGISLLDTLLPQGAAALALTGLWRLTTPLELLALAGLVHAHLGHALPMRRRAVSWAVASATVVGAALMLTFTWRSHDSWSSAPYMSTLPLPALRLTGNAPAASLAQDLPAVAERLAQRARKARQDERDNGEDGSGGAED